MTVFLCCFQPSNRIFFYSISCWIEIIFPHNEAHGLIIRLRLFFILKYVDKLIAEMIFVQLTIYERIFW